MTDKVHMEFSVIFKKPFNSGAQKGQAVTEYLLVLVVVVGIALGVIYQLSGAFRKYVESYFGDYVACLLETGEMPGLGGGAGPTSEGCEALFEPFSLENGRPLIANGSGAGSRTGESAGNGPGADRGRSSSGGNRSARVTRNRSTPNAERRGADSGATTQIAGVRPESSSSSSSSRRSSLQRREESEGRFRISMDYADGDKKNEKAQKKLEAKKGKTSSPQKIAFNIPDSDRDPASMKERDIQLSFGDYLRYILIAAILIAIVVVVGGQLMQVRRNQRAQ